MEEHSDNFGPETKEVEPQPEVEAKPPEVQSEELVCDCDKHESLAPDKARVQTIASSGKRYVVSLEDPDCYLKVQAKIRNDH